MNRLITSKEICDYKEEDRTIYIDKNTIVTPLARDLAREKDISFVKCDNNTEKKESPNIVECRECALTAEEIFNILKAGIENDIFSEEYLESLLRN